MLSLFFGRGEGDRAEYVRPGECEINQHIKDSSALEIIIWSLTRCRDAKAFSFQECVLKKQFKKPSDVCIISRDQIRGK